MQHMMHVDLLAIIISIMKQFFLILIIILLTKNSLAAVSYQYEKNLINSNQIKKNINCSKLVNYLGGLNNIEILWLGDIKEKKYQYVIINIKKKRNEKIFYLCGNTKNISKNSDITLEVISQRNIIGIYYDSINLFEEIFSLISKESRSYIMSTLKLDDFNINRNELNQAYIAGLMKINERKELLLAQKKAEKDRKKQELVLAQKKDEKERKKQEKILAEKKREEEKRKKELLLAQIKPIEVFKPKNTSKDKTPPKIIIAKNITANNSNYVLEGKVEDKGSSNVYVEIDGIIQKAKNNKFLFKRFSPVDEKVKIVAIDQWGNRSKPKIVNVKIEKKDNKITKSLEKLNPSKIKAINLNKNKVALIIGIENYDKTSKATYANKDAQYFYEYANLTFGIPTENIKLLVEENANFIQSVGTLKKWLPSKISKGRTDLIIFFAGHGLASIDGSELYLLLQDSEPDLLEDFSLSRNKLFKIIKDLNPKSVTIFLDACYTGFSRDNKMLLADARPIRIVANEEESIPDNFTIFSASKLDQISSGLKEANHGIFSYYLMKGLEGKADSNKDYKITNGELLAYMDLNVSQKAAELGRQQNPSLAGNPEQVLMRYR